MTEGEFAPFIEGLIAAKVADEMEPKKCPFCGCDRLMTWHAGHRDLPWAAQCMGCMAEGPWAKTEKEAIELWNRRVKE